MTGKIRLFLVLMWFATLLTWCPSNAKVVVFFPMPGTSHIRCHTNVARAMADLGHETWVCMPHFVTTTGTIDTSGINVLSYGKALGDVESRIKTKTNIYKSFWGNITQSVADMPKILSVFEEIMFSILSEGLSNMVKELKPDLFVIDGLPFVKSVSVVPYKLGIPYAMMGNFHDVMGYRIPFSPGATPLQGAVFNDQMDFLERLQVGLMYLLFTIQPFIMDPDAVSMFAPEKPHKTLSELVTKAEVYIIELDPIMDYPRPMLPNTKMIGGTSTKPAKPLMNPFKDFVEKSKKGVIIVSFGSYVVHVPRYIFDKINTACKTSGLNVVWRSDQHSPDPQRILTKEWLPQNDLLGHANTKLFISHCGKNGQYEALYHGVPILCMPIFGDQLYNAKTVQMKGCGLQADMRFTTTEELSGLISELLTNTTYKINMAKASKLFRLLYKSPMKEAAFWLDHVMEYGGDYMRAASQTMPLYQFLMLDVMAVISVVIVVVVFIVYIMIRSCVRVLCKSNKSKSKSE